MADQQQRRDTFNLNRFAVAGQHLLQLPEPNQPWRYSRLVSGFKWMAFLAPFCINSIREPRQSGLDWVNTAITVLLCLVTLCEAPYFANFFQKVLSLAVSFFRSVCDYTQRLYTSLVSRKNRVKRTQFFDLPPEIRIMIYEASLGDSTLMPLHRNAVKTTMYRRIRRYLGPQKLQHNMFLGNKRLHAEFRDAVCRRATFILQSRHDQPVADWSVPPTTRKLIRNLDLQIAVTSEMLGASSYREAPDAIPFRHQIEAILSDMPSMRRMNIHVRAIPDHLWNPVFIWLYTLEALKTARVSQLQTVTFGMGDWVPGANKAVLGANGQWSWNCDKGHRLGDDPTQQMDIRQFCSLIFRTCNECLEEKAARRQ